MADRNDNKHLLVLLSVLALTSCVPSKYYSSEKYPSRRVSSSRSGWTRRRSSYYTADSVKNENFPSLCLFNFETGASPMYVAPATLAISFPYYKNAPNGPKQLFNDSITLKGSTQSRVFNFGWELGKPKGLFAGLNFLVYDSYLPNSNFGDNFSFEIKLGYGFQLAKRWYVRPAILYDDTNTTIWFGTNIDNRNADLYILGQEFPYKKNHQYKGQTRTAYNQKVGVSFNERNAMGKCRIELSYALSPFISVQVNAGYCWQFTDNENIRIAGANQLKLPLTRSGLEFSTGTVSSNKIFNYQGVFWNVGVSVRWPITVRTTERKRFSRSWSSKGFYNPSKVNNGR